MSVNFGGFKNAGSFLTVDKKGQILSKKIWAQLTNEDSADLKELKPLLSKYPDKENLNFLRVVVPTKNIPIKDSFISINGKATKFDDLTKEDIPFVKLVNKFLSDISNPDKKLTVNSDYLYSEDAFKNAEIAEKDFVDDFQKTHAMTLIHHPDVVKNLSKIALQEINNKLVETFSK